jgi:heavy metal-(Cd/Co/Hg/Pb/Zn)-translocating P-type ATPase
VNASTANSSSPAKPGRRTWSQVARLVHDHPEVKQLRLDRDARAVTLGFYEAPSNELLERIKSDVARELSGEWDIAIKKDGSEPLLHLHQVDGHTTEVHRPHPPNEPPVIWKRVALPVWRNRPFPRPVSLDYRTMLALAGICGLTTLAGFLLRHGGANDALISGCFAIAYLSGGWFTAQDVWQGLKRGKIDIHFLMIAVAFGALIVNAALEGATLLFLFSLSNALEQFANHRTRRSIESLLQVAPKQALRREYADWTDVSVEEVRPGDELLVKPGQLFPVDGVVIEGATSADESALTGEAIPVAKQAGDSVSGGTINLDGQCVIRATREMEESAASRIVALIEIAQQQKAPAQRFTDSFSRYYTWIALALSAVVFGTLLVLQRPFGDALYRTMTVLVVASPCALVLSIPSAILVAIAAGARRGILFRGGIAVENLAGATQFAFDKTGTLTKGALRVARISAFDSASEDNVLQIAASLAQFSTHPLARAIVAEGSDHKLPLLPARDFLNVAGLGMEGSINGQRIFVGSRRLLRDRRIPLPEIPQSDEGEVWVATTNAIGLIHLRDEIRPAAKGVVDFLKRSGVSVALLTGDRSVPAGRVAEQVGITDVRAELSPQAKLQCIHDWRAAGRKVAMVGDGINDAPSLTAADVSLGMGARGSDAALEQADVILMHDKIENVEQAFRLSRRARAIIWQNLIIALGVVFVLIISAVAEKINLTTGVIGHEGSTVVVILNGLRLLRSR